MFLFKITDLTKATASLFCLILVFTLQSMGQVSIAPTSLFFDDQSRFSSLTVSNGGQQAQEISISTGFGYPANRNGSIAIVNDSTMAERKSIADWIKIFPKNFTLQPQQRQTVRFVVRAPQDLQEGGYWSRVQITSNPVSPPIESVEEGEIGAQVSLVVSQVISAHYHTQNAQTGIDVTDVSFTQVDSTNTGQIAVSMEQTGNAPFVGSISVTVSKDGQTVYSSNLTNSVYTTITQTFDMDLSDIEPGNYTISGEVKSERRDIGKSNLLQIDPVSFEKQISIK